MPKVNHGPEPKAAPPSLVVILTALRDSYVFLRPEMAHRYELAIDRAEVLEERLTELHDAVEKAIEHLNEVTADDDGTFSDSDNLQEALATLNKVL